MITDLFISILFSKVIFKEKYTIPEINTDIFKLIFEDSRDPIGLSVNGINLIVNQAYIDLFKYENEKDILGTSIFNLIAPDCREKVEQYTINRSSGKEAPSFYETKGLKKDGTEFDIEVKASTYYKKGEIQTLVILRDISDRKQIENYLAMITQSHQIFLRAINESDFLQEICQIITQTGGYDFAWVTYKKPENSEKIYTIARSEPDEEFDNFKPVEGPAELSIRNKKIILVKNIKESCLYDPWKKEILNKGYKSSISIPLIIDDDAIGVLNILSSNINDFNREVNNLKNLTDDISYCIHTMRLKEEQKNLETQLLQAQKMETLGTLAGGIAHDFNNIMTPIMGYAELSLSQMASTDPAYNYNEQILIGAIRAKELVKQILVFSHKEDYRKEPVFIGKIVKDAVQLMGSIIPKTIKIQKHFSRSCGKIMADSAQIHQIIANLCTNSFHAMEKKGGALTIELKKTIITQSDIIIYNDLKKANYAELIISDTGCGMDEDTLKRIFEPFYTTKSVDKGTGLGLSVVHGIVKNHEGSIFVKSKINEGTTFRIFLPLIIQAVVPL